ncbi:MAG: hypothetical protein BWK79_00120 [Beggiatoa sp. IS2]|nr:MAG: hypothetical protein BWK78_00010 [Thiotrichaceae bacterium IS1]OQW96059.1 MAG: hypothetical protein BWK79_00120 [Beggiatoa sp. IS2]
MSIRSLIVERLKLMVPAFEGRVLGVVDLVAVQQSYIKAKSCYIWRNKTKASPNDSLNFLNQIIQTEYAVLITTKNEKDHGGIDSSDVADDLCYQIFNALAGWQPLESSFCMSYERGQNYFDRNMLFWTEYYSLPRTAQTSYDSVDWTQPYPYHPNYPGAYMMTTDVAVQTGHPVYINAENHLELACAESLPRAQGFGLCAFPANPGGNVSVYVDGFISRADWTPITGTLFLIPGKTYYLSNTEPGKLTSTPPTTGYLLSVGTAIYPDTLDIEISQLIQLI